VRLNRRLAPDVYLGVVPVRRDAGGATLVGDDAVVDYAVRMRRLPDSASASAMLHAGTLGHDRLGRLAGILARFYATSPTTPAYGTVDAVGRNVTENFDQVRPFVGRFLSAPTFEAVQAWQAGYLAEHRERFEARIQHGRIRDGHGDLRLEHVYFEGEDPVVLDCIEFNERFRLGDVASDVGFLAMDLDGQGRAELAESFLGRFALESDDYDLYGVVDFYRSYRAWVRGKVAAFLAADGSTPPEKATRKAREAQALFTLAQLYTRPHDRPRAVVAVGGLIGTGKTVLAEALARALALPVVQSDRTRKWLAGIGPTDRAPAVAYGADVSRRTFEELFRRAGVVLASGRGVILDATFRARALRRRARELAERFGAPFLFVETTCDEATLRERLRRRAAGRSVSDATEALLDRIRQQFEPVTELGPTEHLLLETTRPIETLVDAVTRALGR
jgi:aminoglycoside phosphotransferase family enzyme/predicted kinase